MNTIVAKALQGGTAALLILTAAGCQSSKQLEEVRAIAQRADQNATAALQAATAARDSANAATQAANDAKSAAASAQTAANQALQVSQTAQANVDAANEKADRMFRRTVSK
jgi:uncharacterized membrane protein YdbT with pleckstrin-like domain